MSAEVTRLSRDEERAFRAWAYANGITDVDAPQSRYDYRAQMVQDALIAVLGGQQ